MRKIYENKGLNRNHNSNSKKAFRLIGLFLMCQLLISQAFAQKTYYIDPTYSGSTRDGSITTPFKALSEFKWEAGATYLLKSGTTLSTNTPIVITPDRVTFGSYGTGARPIIKGYFPGARALTLSSNYGKVQNLDIQALDNGPDDAAGCVIDMIRPINPTLDNCKTTGGTRGINASITKGRALIINCHVTDTWDDGMYHRDNDTIIIENTLVERVNMKYHINPNQTYAGGDNIQFDYLTHFEIRNCVLDKTATGGKFCLIADHFDTGITENTKMIGAKMQHGVYIGIGNHYIYRYNYMSGCQYGLWNKTAEVEAYYNVFKGTALAAYQGDSQKSSTLSNNLFTGCVDAVGGWNEKIKMTNNIFYNNTRIINGSTSNITGSYNCHFPNNPGANESNSFKADPMFTNAAIDEYHLKQGSPCIDAGTTISGLNKDMTSCSVPFNGKTDVGPCEFGPDNGETPPPPPPPTENTAPVIKIEYAESVWEASAVTVDASKSSDPDGDNLTYSWTNSSGLNLVASNTSVVKFLAPDVNKTETVNLELTISDGKISQSSTISIDVKPFKPHISKLKPVKANASSFQDPNYPQNAIDENIQTRWSAEGEDSWLTIELENDAILSHFKIALYGGSYRTGYFDLYASGDNETWDLLIQNANTSGISDNTELFQLPNETYSTYKYVRLVGKQNSENNWNSYSELVAYGSSFQTDDALSISDKTTGESFNIYPNPSSGDVVLQFPTSTDISVNSVRVFTLNGSAVFEKVIGYQTENIQFNHDLSDGIYLLQVNYSDGTQEGKKLIVKR